MPLPPAPPLPTFSVQPGSTVKPAVSAMGSPGSLLAELHLFNGHLVKDHWAYLIRTSEAPDLGLKIHAAGDFRTGFEAVVPLRERRRQRQSCSRAAVRRWRSPRRPGAGLGKRIMQRDCQTWIVELADQLVLDGTFAPEVASYLRAVQQ
ncbi:hypothetical protein PspLS_06699 [Pyricularia sp. CBS 133598]|nr:hypothetical protein PspLS_06699 [Pyricularia sp. CBS 133598]